jgi:hypothetical protein
MRRTRARMLFATVAALALMVGVGSAVAANGNRAPNMKQEAARIADRATFEAAVAKSLGTTTAKLSAAVKASALATIDAALASKDITADQATTLKDAVSGGAMPAMRLATAAGVAKELGTTEAKVNAAFADAQKAQATARVDQALREGKITDAQATEMKAKIDAATFPGFGAGPGGPGGHGHHGGEGGPGMGFGPPQSGGGSSSGSSSLDPTALSGA